MSLVLTRVDQRLVHGQVVAGWVPFLRVTRLLVGDDVLAADAWERDMLVDAAPSGVAAEVVSLAEVPGRLLPDPADRTLLLVREPAALRILVEQGLELTEVNLGGLHAREGARRYLDYLFFTPRDLEDLQVLHRHGIRIRARALPDQTPVDLNALLGTGALTFDTLPVP